VTLWDSALDVLAASFLEPLYAAAIECVAAVENVVVHVATQLPLTLASGRAPHPEIVEPSAWKRTDPVPSVPFTVAVTPDIDQRCSPRRATRADNNALYPAVGAGASDCERVRRGERERAAESPQVQVRSWSTAPTSGGRAACT
jgi:hypothetical protein